MACILGGRGAWALPADVVCEYNIASGPADKSLIEFARQSKEARLSVLIPTDALSQFKTNSLQGRFRADEALVILLRRTGLSGGINAAGALTITREPDVNMKRDDRLRSGWVAGVLGFFAAHASAQAPEPQAGAELQEVVVTGSRLQAAGFNAPTPVTVVGVETIEQRAPANISDVLLEQPAFRISGTDVSRAESGIGNPNPRPQTIQATPDLRSLGPQRTLVLINGHRSVGTNWDNVVDINIVPVGLVERIDVVTGGASAAYGSDAVAGVTNVILRNKMQGIKAGVQVGQTQYASARQYTFNLSGGTSLLGDRLHVLGGVDVNRSDAIQDVYGKRFAQDEIGNFTPTTAQRTAEGLPTTVIRNNVEPASIAPGGLAVASNGQAYTFDASGNTVAFQRGTVNSNGQLMYGSTSNYGHNLNNLAYLRLPSARYDFMGRASFDVTDRFSTYVEVGNSRSLVFPFRSGEFMQGTGVGANNPAITIAASTAAIPNPFRTAAINSVMGTGQFTMGRDDTELSFAGISGVASRQDSETRRVVVGFEGSFAGSWKWDAYYQNGRTWAYLERNDLSPWAMQKAVNGCNTSVGLNANQILMVNHYEQLTGKTCVAFNPFGVGRNSQAAIDYVQNSTWQNTHLWQDAASASVSGTPFKVPAGDVAVAGGVEWRQEALSAISDPVSKVGNAIEGSILTNSLVESVGGHYHVREGFVEIGVPVMKDKAFARSLDANAAARVTQYELSGTVRTWKLGLTWDPLSVLRLRLTKSHDIRAAGLRQMFFLNGPNSNNVDNTRLPVNTVGANGSVFNPPASAISTSVGVLAGAPGNPLLRPEVADTVTGGAVFTKGGFSASVDYYYVDMHDTITGQGAQTVIDNCAAGDKTACSYMTFNATSAGGIQLIAAPAINLNRTVVKGLDLEVAYRTRLGPGSLQVRSLVNYQPHNEAINFVTGQTTDSGNTLGSQPKLAYNLSFGYEVSRWQTVLQIRGFGQRRGNSIVYNANGSVNLATAGSPLGPEDAGYNPTVLANATVSKNRWPGQFFVNPSVTFKVNDKVSAFLNVDNLFDRQPPELATNSNVYDFIGRRYRAGVRASF